MAETVSKRKLQNMAKKAVEIAKKNTEGKVADYIPELAAADTKSLHITIRTLDGHVISEGNMQEQQITLQSTAKLIVLIGLLEDFGPDKVFSWVRVEPSGDDFASIARLDQFGPIPSNPMLNAGAIALCSHIPGDLEEQLRWVENWAQKLFNEKPRLNQMVFASERRTGNRNRSLAYLLKSTGHLKGRVKSVLETYFFLCSFETTVEQASYLPMLLANKGKDLAGKQIISEKTTRIVLSIMATCGLYNESGRHLVYTGMPAKSGVSGLILASAMKQAGIAVASPLVNRKGTSVRGEIMLRYLAQELNWHFAS